MTASKFPAEFDNDENLFLVRDSLRLRLLEDYNPGDTSIQVEGDPVILLRWPSTGQLTLTEQCSDIESRAINLSFTSIDPVAGVISGLEIVPGFTDSLKPKRITDVTINVIADHHNNIKDAVIAIEEFVGVKGTTDIEPFGDTLEGRTNFLRNLVLQPKAWFSSNVRVGIVPLEVEFQDLSFRLITDNGGIGDVVLLWDFGDNTTSNISMLSHISVIDEVPGDSIDVLVYDVDGGKVKKTYLSPGIYDVKLTVSNKFGDDECIFPEFIHARPQAPRPAVIRYREKTDTQTSEPGDPENGPFITPPTIRSPINTLIDIEIESGENFATPGYSFAGEQLSGGNPIDPIATYTWVLGDDLIHSNAPFTKGSYSVGGIYDLKLRVDTTFGAYRITTYENSIDIIENENLWLWVFSTPVTVRSYEYGLISESFKTNSSQTLAVVRDASFLDAATIPESTREQQIKEFKRNNGFCQRSTTNSGQQGTAILYWASGRSESDAVSTEKINLAEFNGFLDTYLSLSPISRPWNWVSFNAPSAVYFVFGRTTTDPTPFTSPTNPTRTRLELGSLNVNTAYQMLPENFSNNAVELLQNPAFYYQADQTPPSGFSTGDSIYGHFSVTRSAWKDNTGYLLRNDSIGPFYKIKSFYRTEGTTGDPVLNIRKLQDIQGQTKLEGNLSTLTDGLYFFNNSGSISVYSDTTSIWAVGGPGANSVAYRSIQDSTVQGFDKNTNTLLLATDQDRRAYLSFDYSSKAFIKFTQIDNTFRSLGSRPDGEQWLMSIY